MSADADMQMLLCCIGLAMASVMGDLVRSREDKPKRSEGGNTLTSLR